jgi:hypothetical protein
MMRFRMMTCLIVAVLMTGPLGVVGWFDDDDHQVTAQSSFDSVTPEQLDAIFFQLMDTAMRAMSIDWGNWLSQEWSMPIPAYNAFLVEQGETYTSACGDKTT